MARQNINRILFLTPWFPNAPGDREGNFVFGSASSLCRAGLSVAVLVVRPCFSFGLSRGRYKALSGRFSPSLFSNFGALELARYMSVPRNRLPRLSAWLHDRSVGEALRSLAKIFGADLIHAHTEVEAAVATTVGRTMDIPVVVTLHGINTATRYFESNFLRSRFRNALAAADRVLLVGKTLEARFAEVVGNSNNFTIVPNGFDPPHLHAHIPAARKKKQLRLISVSNLHEGKGIDVSLEALAKIRDAHGLEGWSYTIVGDGSERNRLVALAVDLGLRDKVRFLGARPHDQVYSLLQEADVFVLVSCPEAFGVAYLEAMAAGLLAIGAKGEGPSAFINDGETGFLVPPRDPDCLAERLVAIANDRAELRRMAVEGREHVLRNMSWEKHAQRLIGVYQEIGMTRFSKKIDGYAPSAAKVLS